jgi:hypothetical protein
MEMKNYFGVSIALYFIGKIKTLIFCRSSYLSICLKYLFINIERAIWKNYLLSSNIKEYGAEKSKENEVNKRCCMQNFVNYDHFHHVITSFKEV